MNRQIFISLSIVIVWATSAGAQTWNETFRQKKTQEKYLAEQISGLQAYLDLAKKSYTIARAGLSAISRIKNGELELHGNFLSKLAGIHPKLKGSEQFRSMLENYNRITTSRLIPPGHQAAELLGARQTAYLLKVQSRVRHNSASLMNMALDLLSDGAFQMDDAARMEKLGTLSAQMQQNLSFLKSFSGQARLLTLNLERELQQAEILKKLYTP